MSESTHASMKNTKVLVVEDSEGDAPFLEIYLKDKGYDPVIVRSLEEAVELIDKGEEYFGVISDCNFPYQPNGVVMRDTFADFLGYLLIKNRNLHVVLTSSDPFYADIAREVGIPFVCKTSAEGFEKAVSELENVVGREESIWSSRL